MSSVGGLGAAREKWRAQAAIAVHLRGAGIDSVSVWLNLFPTMMSKISFAALLSLCLGLWLCHPAAKANDDAETANARTKLKAIPMNEKVTLSDDEWRKLLSPERYRVLREAGTEPPFRNEYFNNHEKGIFVCGACGNELFSSETKFESGTGWPSFFQPLGRDKVAIGTDHTHGMTRDEVTCARCGSHLGHVFPDGPKPTGQRYCMNSAALQLRKE